METEKMIRCFAAVSEAGLRDMKHIMILSKPVEATQNHFFEKLTNIACHGHWAVGRRLFLSLLTMLSLHSMIVKISTRQLASSKIDDKVWGQIACKNIQDTLFTSNNDSLS